MRCKARRSEAADGKDPERTTKTERRFLASAVAGVVTALSIFLLTSTVLWIADGGETAVYFQIGVTPFAGFVSDTLWDLSDAAAYVFAWVLSLAFIVPIFLGFVLCGKLRRRWAFAGHAAVTIAALSLYLVGYFVTVAEYSGALVTALAK